MFQEIYIIDSSNELVLELREIFENEKNYKFRNINPKDLDFALKNIPDLIIINEESIETDTIELCRIIRKNEDNSITPVLVIARNKENRLEIIKNSIEYVITKQDGKEYLYYTIKNITRLLSVNRTVSPLTGLPRECTNTCRIKKETS